MHFQTEMVFGVVAVIEPGPVVKFVIATHALGNRFIRIAAVMTIVAV
jgi:hypothetical protein